MANMDNIRTFPSGSTRDTVEGKLSYAKALSPIVLRAYVEYLDKHRLQSDGNLRDFDNWKKGIPTDTYLDSLGRHLINVWLLADGFEAFDNHGPVSLEDSLCGIIFNAMGWLHEHLKTTRLSAADSPCHTVPPLENLLQMCFEGVDTRPCRRGKNEKS